MVTSFKVGTFQSIAGTGSQSITGVGFTPKALIIYTHELNSLNNFSSDAAFDVGFASSTSDERYASMYNFDASASADCTEQNSIVNIIAFDFNLDGTLDTKADLTALGVDGFTLNWTQNNAGATRFNYIAVGGTDLVDTQCGHFDSPGATGDQSVTGVGFMPDLVIFHGTNMTTDNTVDNTTGSVALGCMNSAGEQCTSAVISEDAQATMDTARYQRTTKCLAIFTKNNVASLSHEATFVSMDSDGFTINYTTATTANKHIMYLALKGPSVKIDSFTSPTAGTAPVEQAITGTGFEPRGVIFFSIGATTSASIQTHNRLSMGAASFSDEQACIWEGDEDAAADSITASRLDNANCIRVSDEVASAGSTTTQALAVFTSLDSDGFTLSWTTKDASNAYEIIYIAVGDTAVVVAAPDTKRRVSTSMMLPSTSIVNTTRKKRYITTSMIN